MTICHPVKCLLFRNPYVVLNSALGLQEPIMQRSRFLFISCFDGFSASFLLVVLGLQWQPKATWLGSCTQPVGPGSQQHNLISSLFYAGAGTATWSSTPQPDNQAAGLTNIKYRMPHNAVELIWHISLTPACLFLQENCKCAESECTLLQY